MASESTRLLGSHRLLNGVAVEDIEQVLDRVVTKKIRKGTMLNSPGVAPGLLHLVISGRLRAFQLTADNRELLLELIPEGGFDGILSVAGHRGHYTVAEEDSVVASLPLSTLEQLIATDPKIAGNLLQLIIERLANREVHLEAVSLHDPTQQIARQLLALGETLGRRVGSEVLIEPRITHQMLADMLGIRRETVTLHLGRLATSGAISIDGRHLRLKIDALERLIDEPAHNDRPRSTQV